MCAPAALEGVSAALEGAPITPGDRAQLLPSGLAAAPAGAPLGGQGDHRRRQPDRREAVHLRRRPRPPAVRDRADVRLLEQRRAPAVRRRPAPGRLRRAVGDARVVRRARPGPVGHAVRERRSRVHVRRRPALGHAQRRRPRRREHRDRLAPADPERRRVRGAPPGGAVTGRSAVSFLCAFACALPAAGCGGTGDAGAGRRRPVPTASDGRPANRSTAAPRSASSAIAEAQATHERPSPPPPRQTATHTATTATQAIRAFVTAYINWNAQTVSADMRSLAARSVGQARAAMTLAAAETAGDYELQQGGIANSGTVEAVAPLSGHPGEYVVVTQESTTASNTTAYQGLKPAWHVALATVQPNARWRMGAERLAAGELDGRVQGDGGPRPPSSLALCARRPLPSAPVVPSQAALGDLLNATFDELCRDRGVPCMPHMRSRPRLAQNAAVGVLCRFSDRARTALGPRSDRARTRWTALGPRSDRRRTQRSARTGARERATN